MLGFGSNLREMRLGHLSHSLEIFEFKARNLHFWNFNLPWTPIKHFDIPFSLLGHFSLFKFQCVSSCYHIGKPFCRLVFANNIQLN